MRGYRQALHLTPAGDHETRAGYENELGNIYSRAADTRQALRHHQRSIQHEEAEHAWLAQMWPQCVPGGPAETAVPPPDAGRLQLWVREPLFKPSF